MRQLLRLLASVLLSVLAPMAWAAELPDVLTLQWTDASRDNREVPVKIYLPAKHDAPAPVVIFSHGLGGSRDGYGYFGRDMAEHGYVVVHLTHHGSDTDAIRAAIKEGKEPMAAFRQAAMNPQNSVNRPKDVSFAIDQLIKLNGEEGPLKGRLDLDRIGIAGHSFGGFTTMAIAGETFAGRSAADPRVKAAIAMSPPANRVVPRQYSQVKIPVMVMTGTLDDSPVLGGKAEGRRQVYEALPGEERYLLVFSGGDHMVFSGRREVISPLHLPGTQGKGARDAAFQKEILGLSRAFFDAYLRGDEPSKTWLKSDWGAKAMLGEDATWDVGAAHAPTTR